MRAKIYYLNTRYQRQQWKAFYINVNRFYFKRTFDDISVTFRVGIEQIDFADFVFWQHFDL